MPDWLNDWQQCQRFVELMKNRIREAFFKYGPFDAERFGHIDIMRTAQKRVELYHETGNTEWLVDAANFLMIEFLYPSHPDADFRATSSDESPGYWLRKLRDWTNKHKDEIR